jgi:hypothetical protein
MQDMWNGDSVQVTLDLWNTRATCSWLQTTTVIIDMIGSPSNFAYLPKNEKRRDENEPHVDRNPDEVRLKQAVLAQTRIQSRLHVAKLQVTQILHGHVHEHGDQSRTDPDHEHDQPFDHH